MTPNRQDYMRDGFVVVRNFIPQTGLDALARDLAETFHHLAQTLGLGLDIRTDRRGFTDLIGGVFDHDQRAYLACAKLAQHLVSVHRVGCSVQMTDVLAALGLPLPSISTRPVIHFMADRLKITGGYHKTPPHQDWRSVQGSVDGLTVWAPLFDVGLDDYPIEIVPGSHHRGLLPDVEDVPNYRIRDDLWRDEDFEPLVLGRGDAVFFSGFLMHRTGKRGGDLVRVSLEYRFNNVAEPHYAARNYPNPYLYRPDMTVLTPDFPGPAEVAEVFGDAARPMRTGTDG